MNCRVLNSQTRKFTSLDIYHQDIQIVSKYGQETITVSFQGMKVPLLRNFSDTLISMSLRVSESFDVYVQSIYTNHLFLSKVFYDPANLGEFHLMFYFDFDWFYIGDCVTGRATNIAYIGPSVTPYNDLNPGYRIYYIGKCCEKCTIAD